MYNTYEYPYSRIGVFNLAPTTRLRSIFPSNCALSALVVLATNLPVESIVAYTFVALKSSTPVTTVCVALVNPSTERANSSLIAITLTLNGVPAGMINLSFL